MGTRNKSFIVKGGTKGVRDGRNYIWLHIFFWFFYRWFYSYQYKPIFLIYSGNKKKEHGKIKKMLLVHPENFPYFYQYFVKRNRKGPPVVSFQSRSLGTPPTLSSDRSTPLPDVSPGVSFVSWLLDRPFKLIRLLT